MHAPHLPEKLKSLERSSQFRAPAAATMYTCQLADATLDEPKEHGRSFGAAECFRGGISARRYSFHDAFLINGSHFMLPNQTLSLFSEQREHEHEVN